MLGRKAKIEKNERSKILQIISVVKQIDWESASAFSTARTAMAATVNALCDTFRNEAKEYGFPVATYIRNLIASAPKLEIDAWTAFSYIAVSQGQGGCAELKETAHFLFANPNNCGFLFQLIARDKYPSFDSAVFFFKKKPLKGFELGLRILKAEKNCNATTIVKNIVTVYQRDKKILSGKTIVDAWVSHGVPRINFKPFMKLPASIQEDILSSRIHTLSILKTAAIDRLKTNPKACRQSPLFAFHHLKGKGSAIRIAMARNNWSHPGLIPLLTLFLDRDVKKAVFNACRRFGYGSLDFADIQAIPDQRLKNAFTFATSNAKKRLAFFKKLNPGEQAFIIEDIPDDCWSITFAAISGKSQFKSIFSRLNRTGTLAPFLRRYLVDKHPKTNFLPTAKHTAVAKSEKIEQGDRIALVGAAAFGLFDLIHEAIVSHPSRYGMIFEEHDPILFKIALSSAENNQRLVDLIRVHGQRFIAGWLMNAPVTAIKRFGELLKSCDAVIPIDLKKELLKGVLETCPHRLKSLLQTPPDIEHYRFVFEHGGPKGQDFLENLINWKNNDRCFVWEPMVGQQNKEEIPPSLVELINSGKNSVLKKAYELCPDVFYKQAINRLPLRQVLPTAFRHPISGLYIERIYPRSRLLKEINWGRETYKNKPTVSTAYETALALSLPDAPYLLYLATYRWKDQRNRRPGQIFDHLYHTYPLPKKSGGSRKITAPDKKLKRLQRRVLRNGFENIAVHPAAHGFLKNRSIVSNADNHTGQKLVVNMDIASFFPNTQYKYIVQASQKLAKGKLSTGAVMLVADICSYNGGLPTGAPTSPHIGNIILHPVDKAIEKVSQRSGINYTRYADDLTFSGDDNVKRIIPFVRKVLSTSGYKVDPKKTNLFRRGRRQMVTGLVVNEKPNLPRHIRKKIRAAAHWMQLGKTPLWHNKPVAEDRIMGLIAHLNAASPKEASKYKKQARSSVAKGKKES